MADYIDAGKLNKAAQVLELRETAPGVWEWVPARRTWASITLQPKTNLFSKVGIGARNAAVIVRRQALPPPPASFSVIASYLGMRSDHGQAGISFIKKPHPAHPGVRFSDSYSSSSSSSTKICCAAL